MLSAIRVRLLVLESLGLKQEILEKPQKTSIFLNRNTSRSSPFESRHRNYKGSSPPLDQLERIALGRKQDWRTAKRWLRQGIADSSVRVAIAGGAVCPLLGISDFVGVGAPSLEGDR
jgi:hypothetical protein